MAESLVTTMLVTAYYISLLAENLFKMLPEFYFIQDDF